MTDDGISPVRLAANKQLQGVKGPPEKRSEKDFQKVLAKKEREHEEEADHKSPIEKENVSRKESYSDVAEQLALASNETKSKKPSLFDLANTAQIHEAEIEEAQEAITENLATDVKNESLSALFKGYGSQEKLKSIQMEAASAPNEEINPQDLKKDRIDAFLKDHPQFAARELPDLSIINPNTTLTPMQTIGAGSRAAEIKEIIDQIIDKLYTVKVEGKTDTLITLKHPPLFAGANVVISSFKSAKGEFNIAFENLTQAAKNMLDLKQNQDSLLFGLEQKGYTVHIITTTTLNEASPYIGTGTPNRNDKDGQPSKENRQSQDRQKNQED